MTANRARDARGVAAVEFALVVPFLLLLLFGMIYTGLAYTDHLSVTNAVREGSRFGAAIDYSPSPSTWATSVRDRVRQVYNNSANQLTDQQVCVELINSSKVTISGASWTGSQCGAAPDLTTFTPNPGSCAVVVWAKKPATIELVIAPNLNFYLGARSISYYGLTVGTTCTAK